MNLEGCTICVKPGQPRYDGKYELVRETFRLNGEKGEIWFDPSSGGVVDVEVGNSHRPYDLIVTDFDGSVLAENGFYPARRLALCREAGINGPDVPILKLVDGVFQWEGTLERSHQAMIDRIRNARHKDGSNIPDDQASALNRLVQPEMLSRWSDATGIPYDRSKESLACVQAARVEQIGIQMLEKNPICVVKLAPLQPGVENFFRMIPEDVPIAIASGTRKATIRALLDAHAHSGHPFLKDRVGTLIVGEEDSQAPKPERRFYDYALCSIGGILHNEGRIPKGGMSVVDMLFIGDRVASGFDAPFTRKGMDHMVINAGTPTSLGPKVAMLSNFPTLITQLEAPQTNNSPILQRLARTVAV